ncbi:uncharacterized protein LOC117306832 [Asterias rubens]|uniref:uncharacterized protein LOC117306832 n=1 Tax=Asterias rubens TaxID=7604 RepID=UPI0014555C6A|nr:uncharacterized protein LOC117306832 [Asterias rubens]
MGKPERSFKRSFSGVRHQISFRQPIRPFISSTFVDFFEERDHLVKRVFPQLNSLCHERGTHFSPIDLRWGINEEQSQSGNVVSLCLDYINSCSPFFICLLGERYGSHRPIDADLLSTDANLDDINEENTNWLDKNYHVAAANGHNWILQEAYQCCSITELEIIQAAYLNDSQYSRFYFRDVRHIEDKFTDLTDVEREEKLKVYRCENEEVEMRVRDLKRRIVNKGLPVRFFRTVEELAEKVLEDWKFIINQMYPPLQDFTTDVDGELFREWAAHEAYAETRRRVFIQTPNIYDLYEKLDDQGVKALNDDTQEGRNTLQPVVSTAPRGKQPEQHQSISILTLVGERGCGKTAIVANWVKHFRTEYPGLKVISHFVGSSALSADITSFLRRVTYELRGEFVGTQNESSNDAEDMSNFHHICEAFVASVGMGPCVLVLDGIDELSGTLGQTMHQVKEMSWLPEKLPAQCKIVLTTVRSDLTYKSLSQRQDTQVLLVPLFTDRGQKSSMVTENLAIHCKCLDEVQLQKVVTSKLSDRPLFLSILANELRVRGTYGNLDKVIDQYIEAVTFRDLWKCVIQRWIRDYGWTTDGRSTSVSSDSSREDMSGWVAEVLRLISCSRHGLSEQELLQLLRMMGYTGQAEVTAFDFALFRSATFDALVERPGGLMSFFHQHLREAVEHSLLGMIAGTAGMPDSPSASAVEFLPRGLNQQKRVCHEALSSYFWKQSHSLRRTGELPWQLEKCGDIQGLFNILTEPEVFLMMCQDSIQSVALKLDLLRYWQRLSKNGYEIADAYEKMVMKAMEEYTWTASVVEPMEEERGEVKDADRRQKKKEKPNPLSSKKKNPHQKLSVIEEYDAASSDATSTHQLSTDEQRVNLTIEASHRKLSSTSTQEVISASEEVKASSSSDEDAEEVWEDAREEPESNSDEDEIFYEYKPGDRCKMAVLAMQAGKFLAERSRFQHSERLLSLAHQDVSQKFPLSTPEQLFKMKVEENLADLHRFQLHRYEAKKFYHKALNTLSNIAACESDDIYKQLVENKGRLLNHLGFMAVKQHTKVVDEAEKTLRNASDCMRKANSIAGLATAQFILGLVQVKKTDYVIAEECLREALQTRERWHGKSHPHVAEVLNELGGLLCNPRNVHRCDRIVSETYFRRALQIREQSYGRDHLLVGTTLFHLGKLLKSSGSHQCKTEAVVHLSRSHDIRTTNLGANHVLTKAVRQALKEVQTQLMTGDYDYAPVKQPDRRTKENPYSSLSWHEGALMDFEKQARAKSAVPRLERASRGKQRLKTAGRSPVEDGLSTNAKANGWKQSANSNPDNQRDRNQNPAEAQWTPSLDRTQEASKAWSTPRRGGRTQQRPKSMHGGRPSERSTDTRQTASAHTAGRHRHPQSGYSRPQQTQATKHDSLQSLCLIPRSNKDVQDTVSNGTEQTLKSTLTRFNSWSAGNRSQSAKGGRVSSSRGSDIQRSRPQSSVSQVSHVSHRSRCDIPQAFQMHPSNDRTIRGPHSQIQAVLGDPPCPRPVQPKVLHTAAWFHESGRYPKTPSDVYPPRRHQKRPMSVPSFATDNRFSILDSMQDDDS